MKKNLIVVGVVLGVLFISLVSAGWFTGNAVASPESFYVFADRTKEVKFNDVKYTISNVEKEAEEVCFNIKNKDTDAEEKVCGALDEDISITVGMISINVKRIGELFFSKRVYARLQMSEVEITCTDSDGGLDYFVKGTTSGSESRIVAAAVVIVQGVVRPDICVKDNQVPDPGFEEGLFEYYCNSKGLVDVTDNLNIYNCPNGCEEGACLTEPVQTTSLCTSASSLGDSCSGGYYAGDIIASLEFKSGGGYTWATANSYCGEYSYAGYSNWRLPAFNELKYLVDNRDSIPVSLPYAYNFWTEEKLGQVNYVEGILTLKNAGSDKTNNNAKNGVWCVSDSGIAQLVEPTAVTYRGVLDMLNDCTQVGLSQNEIEAHTNGITCNQICSNKCILGYRKSMSDLNIINTNGRTGTIDCDIAIGPSDVYYATCLCCSTP